MNKIIFLTNIPAPYRVSMFNELENISKNYSNRFNFKVLFMRSIESDRNWEVNTEDFKFDFEIGNGIYYFFKNYHFHFNPILIWKCLTQSKEMILGASWNNFNVLVIILLKRLGFIKSKISIWSEANYLTLSNQKQSYFKNKLRKWVFNSVEGFFIIPGKMAEITFGKWEIHPQKIILFPNLVSEKLFLGETPKSYSTETKNIFLIVARLNEQLKGIINFIESISIENVKKIHLRIVGDGPDKKEIINFINNNNLHENITLLGSLTQKEVSYEYMSSDVFVLPSFSDPSPLTVVEAVSSGLPLLISERCGNHFEAVEEGVNGYVFNPYDKASVKKKFELMLHHKESWSEFSYQSIEIAKKRFNNKKTLKLLIESFL